MHGAGRVQAGGLPALSSRTPTLCPLQEAVESCLTRVTKLELQQQQQQVVSWRVWRTPTRGRCWASSST